MPIVVRIGLEPMQPTYFFGRNRTIYLCYSLHLSRKSFFLYGKPYFLHHLDIVLPLTLYLLPNSLKLFFLISSYNNSLGGHSTFLFLNSLSFAAQEGQRILPLVLSSAPQSLQKCFLLLPQKLSVCE